MFFFVSIKFIDSASLGTNPSKQTTTQQFFSSSPPPPQTPKNLASPHRQTKSPDNSNMLHMFNNNTCADFGAASKYVLIPSYVIQVIQQNQNVTKPNCIKSDKEKVS